MNLCPSLLLRHSASLKFSLTCCQISCKMLFLDLFCSVLLHISSFCQWIQNYVFVKLYYFLVLNILFVYKYSNESKIWVSEISKWLNSVLFIFHTMLQLVWKWDCTFVLIHQPQFFSCLCASMCMACLHTMKPNGHTSHRFLFVVGPLIKPKIALWSFGLCKGPRVITV